MPQLNQLRSASAQPVLIISTSHIVYVSSVTTFTVAYSTLIVACSLTW